ncbi:MAG TPA: fructose bisphosphate aldolase [Arachnia sp.]|jgi:fructose-bisphosphate aldolase class I|nr:fructose bisphosphate aldolase [Arachnia sp.]
MFEQQYQKMSEAPGFVAALDQSGGSTPKTLQRYGLEQWENEAEMFDLVHAMRSRIMASRSFDGDRILATILFAQTVDREVAGQPTPRFLWDVKHIVPIVKVDRGLEAEVDGAQLMKPIDDLDEMVQAAGKKGVFGTKMRSVVRGPGAGAEAAVAQQLYLGRRILAGGLVPILEPEVDIASPHKAEAERHVHDLLAAGLDDLPEGERVMLKLTLPEHDDLYADLVAHPRVLRVFALSGGYSRAEATARLARQHGVVASFARALMEGLNVNQSDEEFDAMLDASIEEIFAASMA